MSNLIQMPKKVATVALNDLVKHALVDIEDAYTHLNLIRNDIASSRGIDTLHAKKISRVVRDLRSAIDYTSLVIVSAGPLEEFHYSAVKLLDFTAARLKGLRDLMIPAAPHSHAIDAAFVLQMLDCELSTLPIIIELLRKIEQHCEVAMSETNLPLTPEALTSLPPALTSEQVSHFKAKVSGDELANIALLFLTYSGRQIHEHAVTGPQAKEYLTLISKNVESLAWYANKLTEIANEAQARIALAKALYMQQTERKNRE